jgi:hypothetical protein
MEEGSVECCLCGQQTASPYRINPRTQRLLKDKSRGYCSDCYEDEIRRVVRFSQTLADEIAELSNATGKKDKH